MDAVEWQRFEVLNYSDSFLRRSKCYEYISARSLGLSLSARDMRVLMVLRSTNLFQKFSKSLVSSGAVLHASVFESGSTSQAARNRFPFHISIFCLYYSLL